MRFWKPGSRAIVSFSRISTAISGIRPTSERTHTFEVNCYFAPAATPLDRIRQEMAVVTFKEYALQDGNTLEATQRMLESRAVTTFPLNDQEVLLRQLHKAAADHVDAYVQGAEAPVSISAAS